MTRELLLNMRMVKFYSWEDAYERMITTVRSTEVTFVLKIQIIMAVIFSVAIAAPSVVSMVSFLVLDKIGTGSPATIFSSLSLFNMLSNTIVNIPVVLGFIVDAITASKRITEYLQASVIDPNEKKDFYDNDSIADDDKTAIKIANATFEWDIFKEVDDVESSIKGETSSDSEKIHREEGFSAKSKEDDPGREIVHDSLKVLSNVNLEIKKGEFIVITGSIGVGKTSLLAAIFGLMEKTKGSVAVNGTMIFSGEPWVQNATSPLGLHTMRNIIKRLSKLAV
jgi:ABC-type multidrug transport system fused ATPase/permease subunit